MNRVDMKDWFWKVVGLPETEWIATGKISAAEVNRLIDLGITDFCKLAEPVHIHARGEQVLTPGTSVYAYPSDFMRLRRNVRGNIGGRFIRRAKREDVDMMEGNEYFSFESVSEALVYEAGVVSGSLSYGIYPTPASADTFYFYYLRRPTKLDDLAGDGTEYPDLPEEYHLWPVYWAAWHFFQGNNDVPAGDISNWMSLAREHAQQLRKDTNEMNLGDQFQRTRAEIFGDLECMFEGYEY